MKVYLAAKLIVFSAPLESLFRFCLDTELARDVTDTPSEGLDNARLFLLAGAVASVSFFRLRFLTHNMLMITVDINNRKNVAGRMASKGLTDEVRGDSSFKIIRCMLVPLRFMSYATLGCGSW